MVGGFRSGGFRLGGLQRLVVVEIAAENLMIRQAGFNQQR